MRWRLVASVLGWSVAFGVVAGAVSGQSGDGRAIVSQIRSVLGGLSAPWVVVAWWAGSRTDRAWRGALVGLAATLVALVAFYVVSGTVEAMGTDVVSSSLAWMSANRVWFEAALVSGPIFGGFGGWWARRRSPDARLVVGALLAGEPLVLWATGALFPHGVLSPLTGLPLVVRIVPGLGMSGASATSVAVHVTELAVGVGLASIAVARTRRARRSAAAV